MNLLILNSKVDRADSGLEVAAEWIDALAARVSRIFVITNGTGDAAVPGNVEVRSLGHEQGVSRARRVARFYAHLGGVLRAAPIDACFVHMVPQFAVLAAPVLVPRRIPMVQWYTHRSAPWSLRASVRIVDRVVSASKESLAVETPKLAVTGHGINTARFHPATSTPDAPPVRMLTVGRLSPSKRIERMIDAVARLRGAAADVQLDVIGEARDAAGHPYRAMLEQDVRRLRLEEAVRFHGAVRRSEILPWYQRAHVFVNLSDTDSIDKAVLEAMSCGVPVVTSNASFVPLLESEPGLMLPKGDQEALVSALTRVGGMPTDKRRALGMRLRELVRAHHDLERLADRLVSIFTELAGRK